MIIDMKGKPCPIPVVEAKKALRNMQEGQRLSLVVDNAIAVQNLQKMAEGMGHGVTFTKAADDEYNVIVIVGSNAGKSNAGGAFVVAIGRDRMGAGSNELGKMLIKSYIYALREMQPLPTQLLFFNGGIHLACEGAATLEDLKAMQEKGVSIQVCGACLNYYGLTEKLAVGSITNMDSISTAMAQATRLINL